MKIKTTMRDVRDQLKYGGNVFQVGYCDLQHVLQYEEAIGYHCGVYGWDWDLYKLETLDGQTMYITTGYRNLVGKLVKAETVKRYEDWAKTIMNNRELNYDSRRTFIRNIARELAGELMSEEA